MSPTLDISGIYPPIATPFDEDENISYDHLQENMNAWNKIPFKGYVVLGSNGESVSLVLEEKLKLLRAVREYAKSSHLVIAGAGCHSARETIDLCRRIADDKSADAVLIITPSYFKGSMTDVALRKYYEKVADESPLPVILYNVPKNTGLDISAEVVAQLATHPNIIGLKESGGDITKISRIIHLTKGQEFQVLAGSASFMLPALLMGCIGGICGVANVMGDACCKLYELFKKNDLGAAVALQQELIYPNFVEMTKYGVPGLKVAMDGAKLYGGPSRLPLIPLSETEKKTVELLFQEAFAKVEALSK